MVAEHLLNLRILLVDDDAWSVAYVYEVLSAYGFTNIECLTDSRQVAPAVAACAPDIVLLDIHMPHLDGFEVLEQLRNLEEGEDAPPILVVTSDSETSTRDKALLAGATDFLPKPCEEIVVVARVTHLLRTRAMQKRLRSFEARYAELPDPGRGQDQEITDSERLRVLLRGIPAGVLMQDRDGYATLANAEFCRLFGLPGHPNSLIGTSGEELADKMSRHFADPVAFLLRLREIVLAGEAVSHEQLKLANGETWERDYVPLQSTDHSRGNLWIYRVPARS